MNITFIRFKKNKFGGAERYLERLTNELKKNNISYEIIHSNLPKWLPSWLKVILFNFQTCLWKKNRFYFSLDRIICPDVYRAGDGVHKVFIQKMNKSFLNPLHFVYIFIEKRMFKNAKKIIANSQMVKKEIVDTYNIDKNKIEVIYNGIEIKEKVEFEDIKKEFGIKDEKIILFVGSGFERKGVKEALKIVSQLKENCLFIIIGKEKNIEKYKKIAKNLGIEKKVIFTGPREDVDKFYSLADIFLFPTHYEPFSNVVLEAMNFENVVFTTAQNGASEIVPREFIMKNPKDYSIIDKISKLLNDEKLLNAEKKRAKDIAKNYTIQKNVQKTLEIINETLN